ncbi:hypothetical protein BHE74_00021297 [Ensete ventricosum]|nr:hypothetical protein BHE74_00021297 [Ensete ventricosum]
MRMKCGPHINWFMLGSIVLFNDEERMISRGSRPTPYVTAPQTTSSVLTDPRDKRHLLGESRLARLTPHVIPPPFPPPPPSPSRQCNGFGSPFNGEEGGSGGPRDHCGADPTLSPPPAGRRAMETTPPPPPLPPPQLQRRGKWVVPLLASFFLSSLFISASIFSSSSSFSSSAAASLSRQALLLLSFSQIPTPIGDDPLFVESKLRIRPLSAAAPARPVPRLAYLISGSAGDGASLRRTLRALYHPANQYVLHLDLEAPAAERLELTASVREDPVYTRFRNVRVVTRANLVTYRGPTMVSNTLHAAAILLKEAGDWDWFINLSASDYPLVTQDGMIRCPIIWCGH